MPSSHCEFIEHQSHGVVVCPYTRRISKEQLGDIPIQDYDQSVRCELMTQKAVLKVAECFWTERYK